MPHLQFCSSILEFTKEMSLPEDQQITPEFVGEETLKRVKTILGTNKLTGECTLYSEYDKYDLYVTSIKMPNGVTFMTIFTRHYKDEEFFGSYA